MLDGLMGRAVLTDADAVMGEDLDAMGLHQGREAHRRADEVGEDQERRPVGDQPPWSARPLTIAPIASSRTP